MINKIGYNIPTFQAKLYTHGPIEVEDDANFGLTKKEMSDLHKLAESIGTDEDKIIISAANSKLISPRTAKNKVYQRQANITALVGDKIRTRNIEQTKVYTAYDDVDFWSSPDALKKQTKAEEMLNTNLFSIAKYFMETLVNK